MEPLLYRGCRKIEGLRDDVIKTHGAASKEQNIWLKIVGFPSSCLVLSSAERLPAIRRQIA